MFIETITCSFTWQYRWHSTVTEDAISTENNKTQRDKERALIQDVCFYSCSLKCGPFLAVTRLQLFELCPCYRQIPLLLQPRQLARPAVDETNTFTTLHKLRDSNSANSATINSRLWFWVPLLKITACMSHDATESIVRRLVEKQVEQTQYEYVDISWTECRTKHNMKIGNKSYKSGRFKVFGKKPNPPKLHSWRNYEQAEFTKCLLLESCVFQLSHQNYKH